MADYNYTDFYYMDPVNGSDTNSGLSMSDAFQTLEYAVNSMTTDGSCLFIRRGMTYTKTGGYSPTMAYSDHDIQQPGVISSWPRAESVTYSGTLTNGSAVVSGLNFTPDWLEHCGRYVTLADGNKYLFSDAIDATSAYIDPPYRGGSVVTSGTIVFDADELWDLAQTLDSGDGVDENWDDDSDQLTELVASGTSTYFYFNGSKYVNKFNLAFNQATSTTGSSYLTVEDSPVGAVWKNCLFKATETDCDLLYIRYGVVTLDGCVGKGMATYDSSQLGIYALACNQLTAKNCVLVSLGYTAFYGLGSTMTLQNCKAGFDVPTSHYLHFGYLGANNPTFGRTNVRIVDCDFSQAVTERYYTGTNSTERIDVINEDRAGADMLLLPGTGKLYKNDCSGTDVNQRSGGSEFVYDLDWDRWATSQGRRAPEAYSTEDWLGGNRVFSHDLILPSGTWDLKYYVQSTNYVLDSEDTWMEVLYYSGLQFYAGEMTLYKSDSTIAVRADADDWTNYVCISGLSLDKETHLKTRMYHAKNSSTYRVYVDPLPEVTKVS